MGPGHRSQEPATARQDAYRLGRDITGQYLLVAVADGMSDSGYSHLGANVAVSALVSLLRSALVGGAEPASLSAPELFIETSRQMLNAAEQRSLSADDVRAAVLGAVIPVTANRAGQREAWLAGVADVSAWHRRPGGWRHLAGTPKSGLDANVLSEFLPYHSRKAASTIVRLEAGDVLALTTDGIADTFTMAEGAAAWFAERWQYPPDIVSFLKDVSYEARAQLDDRTAVVVWCEERGARTRVGERSAKLV